MGAVGIKKSSHDLQNGSFLATQGAVLSTLNKCVFPLNKNLTIPVKAYIVLQLYYQQAATIIRILIRMEQRMEEINLHRMQY